MALKQHSDVNEMLRQQSENAATYVLPYIATTHAIQAGTKVLEVGCGEGGVLVPFLQQGCHCVGVDLNKLRTDRAQEKLSNYITEGKLTILYQNVYDQAFISKYTQHFDIIILKDVIEHIPNQEQFIGFPPWYMPFGGHQQLCQSKWASKLPYYHLLPTSIYKALLKLAGEDEGTITELMEIKQTGINIERFERAVVQNKFKIVRKQWYLINPIYKYKFGLEPRKQFWLLGAIPLLRNFVTTCAYYTIQAHD
jgi:SAM-dependent methyltransferase